MALRKVTELTLPKAAEFKQLLLFDLASFYQNERLTYQKTENLIFHQCSIDHLALFKNALMQEVGKIKW